MPKPAWAKQAVKICGLGSQIFDSAIRGLRTLECRIAALYKVGAVQEWSPSAIGEWPSLDFATRYVTPHAFAKGQHAVPFPKDVDPQGILLKTTSPVGIHLEDNHVLYYEACHIEKNKVVYQPVDPAVIRIGQIVQLQVAFTSVPLWGKKGQHQLACKLRSLVILDRNVQEAFHAET
ncbi:hypothetical protein FA95DRAFT_1614430 [Auriscalpium vulgare]|uniref:Uncharacterized protein n=1 Tax=Auriscalpium vulgare TaxID=40419 RepID=A0ACB8R044_9AGAM|nr:hypothetical protein FA95DRAFT_1614430 [Auriscalpium vulgare]